MHLTRNLFRFWTWFCQRRVAQRVGHSMKRSESVAIAFVLVATMALPVLMAEEMSREPAADPLPNRKPVPRMQAIPLPYAQISVMDQGNELIRYHFGPELRRPFWFPVVGPAGRSYTRMGHPHDPVGHGHHNSVWVSHADVNGVSFWADSDPGRIVHREVELLEDNMEGAGVVSTCQWVDTCSGKVLMTDRRAWEVRPLGNGEWYFTLRIELFPPKGGSVTLGATPFGLFGVRVAKTISVADGGGRILNSEGGLNEQGCFRRPARWVDYSGPIAQDRDGGITLMDHPSNPTFPTPFHVRDDGWFIPSLTLNGPLSMAEGETLRLTYRLWIHEGVPSREVIEAHWRQFAGP